MFERGVIRGDVGTFTVHHYRLGDAWRAARDDFDRFDDHENVGVTVFHQDVDPLSRVCQSCERTIGTPKG